MGRVVPFRRRPQQLWRPSLARRQRAAKARLPFVALSLATLISAVVGVAMAGWPT
jgi:hypothetical protein